MPRAHTPSTAKATEESRAEPAPQAESVDKPQRGIQALDATGELLAALVAAGSPLSLRDLASAAGMPSAKAFPHLVSLLKTGLLARDAAGRYEAGPLSLELGLLGLARLSPVREADAELVDLAASTGMSVALAVPGPLGPTVVRLEESPRPLHVSLRPGTVMSLVNTAIGRVFAAWLDDDMRAELLVQDGLRLAGAPSPSSSARTQSASPDPRYAERLAAIRAQRLDTALDNPIPGISTVAAPVFDHTGSVCLVLALMGPSGNFDTASEGDSAQRLSASAERLSRRFGYVAGAASL
ncbi:Pectin degradation repressor protein KdgR [Paraburkholderia caffeinitolerans]|uniref:Pectin degradation repressor protein KdgR n=1 Tax=Paraburkholderia caffeinitolerans TaxID=1723730 RepID=A0A6J5G184_9BURK|nr:IclR family transcriptional regulator C-terminal domain-containing protein [Paraburkholderia caffeinitolerans]CAB3791347.1 Pectin degradation repressor protein KdgR [Paraburkholderia caffeinitolerans]